MQIKPGHILFFGILLLVLSACNQDEIITDSSARLSFSTDTITFDTVFTTVGTITKAFKVYNPHDKYFRISQIYLKEGSASNYRFSIDGMNGTEFFDLDIPPKDSVYIFVEATLDPVSGNLPLVVEDALIFLSNGNEDAIVLEAFGQNVHFYNYQTIEDEIWTNDKPYLIYGNLTVDKDFTLEIQEGVKIYMHSNSSLEVLGTLKTRGTLEEPVVFKGDRMDGGYGASAGRWGAVYFDLESSENQMEYTTIINATAGIQVGYPNEDNLGPDLELINVQVLNSSFAGIFAFNAKIDAYNCLIADANYFGFACFLGGTYNFYHSTFSINGALTVAVGDTVYRRVRDGSAVFLANYYYPYQTYDNNYVYLVKEIGNDLVEANFYNCIIYGNSTEEFDTVNNLINNLNYYLDHCIVRSDSLDSVNSSFINEIILNKDPLFLTDSATKGKLDFQLDKLSPAKDAGDMEIINQHPVLEFDYNGNSRISDGKPDLGAFEQTE